MTTPLRDLKVRKDKDTGKLERHNEFECIGVVVFYEPPYVTWESADRYWAFTFISKSGERFTVLDTESTAYVLGAKYELRILPASISVNR